MKTLYIDESGDHNLVRIDPFYPIFVLGGVLVDKEYHDRVIIPEIDQLKSECFGNTNVVLHLYDVKQKRGEFASLQNQQLRRRFWSKMISLMRNWDYTVIACAIRKTDHRAKYGSSARDPYFYALEIIVERFALCLDEIDDAGLIVAEARRPDLDLGFQTNFNYWWSNGTGPHGTYLDASTIQVRISGAQLEKKSANIAGLQLADFVLSPIGRHLLGKPDGQGWQIAEEKFRRDPETGSYVGWGLKVLP